jgi:shikimate kinase
MKERDREVKNIFLIGYRGTGKTTVAQILAERLGWSWTDADAVLEARHARNIRAIFAEEGESGFREKESAILDEIVRLDRQVIATGGGIILKPENRRRLRSAGCVVWLMGDANTLWKRVQQDVTTQERRPQLTVGGKDEIEELLRTREPLYRECADLMVDTTDRSPEEVALAILAQITTV